MKIWGLIFLLLLALPQLSWARPPKWARKNAVVRHLQLATPDCARLLTDAPPKVFRLASYNAKDLERGKPREQITRVVENLRAIDPDVAVIQEVQSYEMLLEFNRKYFDGRYDVILRRGNDIRGIDIAFLVRKGMNVDLEIETHANEMWRDPSDRQMKKLFSRDAPVIIVKKRGEARPLFAVIGNHAKAIGDDHSYMLRSEQYRRLAQIVSKYQRRYGVETPIILAGDFNTPIHRSVEVEPVLNLMTDAFDEMGVSLNSPARITHTYIPGRGPTDYTQMDGFLISNGSRAKVIKVDVLRDFTILPVTKAERAQQGSDHFPVYVDIELTD
jgi:endonuclease/exonuclease/phosphatase family metal-dependent hydrolase